MSRYWYSYLGGPGTTPQLNPANYALIPQNVNNGKPNCIGVTNVCAIYSRSGGASPQSPFSANLRAYITAGVADNTVNRQPDTGKAFLYKRD